MMHCAKARSTGEESFRNESRTSPIPAAIDKPTKTPGVQLDVEAVSLRPCRLRVCHSQVRGRDWSEDFSMPAPPHI